METTKRLKKGGRQAGRWEKKIETRVEPGASRAQGKL